MRNYHRLQLDLQPGMTLIEGDNGQGKSNLLEALYMLAIAKSQRAATDRELVRKESVGAEFFSQVAAVVQRDGEEVNVQVDFENTLDASVGNGEPRLRVQKRVRVNGVPRRAFDLVGEVNAVLFTAQDLDVVYGSPNARRRYLDILISQIDRGYMRALQEYQRILAQRNHLLKGIRRGGFRASDLAFWDEKLSSQGGAIMARRQEALRALGAVAASRNADLASDGERLELPYRPSFDMPTGGSAASVVNLMRAALAETRSREIMAGHTIVGPHRDDFELQLNGLDVGLYASRGQARTALLALKLAEAEYLSDARGRQPILLLDDALSELDSRRRRLTLQRVSQYRQSIITTADPGCIEPDFLRAMTRFRVENGRLEPVNA